MRRPRQTLLSSRSSSNLTAVAAATAHYDLIIIGSGPSAVACARESAGRFGKRVAVIDKGSMIGGVCVHTGTIPSKTFREAVLHLTGYRHKGFYSGQRFEGKGGGVRIADLLSMVKKVEVSETGVITDQLKREGVDIIGGTARFVETPKDNPNRVIVLRSEQSVEIKTSIERHLRANLPSMTLEADKFLIAPGTRPLRPPHIPFDGQRVIDSDQLLWGGVKEVPRNLIVCGAGVIGMEYASMVGIIPGTHVTIIDPRKNILPFADEEVIRALCFTMRKNGARFLLGEHIERVELIDDGERVIAHLKSGKSVMGDGLLYTSGRVGNTDALHLNAVGLHADSRGLLTVNDFYQTEAPDGSIYACGDVIGYPALASTSMEQGRRAAMHMWAGEAAVVLDDDLVAAADATFHGTEPASVFTSQEEDSSSEPLTAEDLQGGVSKLAEALAAKHIEAHSKVHALEANPLGGALPRSSEQLFPYGIYTIPEVSMVGKTEAQLTSEGVSYEIGTADYQELAKGQMLGGVDGFLKLIFHTKTLKLLGVHCFGEGATEIVHIGQVVMSQGGTIEYFKTAVFNYPTLAEAYNVAALDGLRKVRPFDKSQRA